MGLRWTTEGRLRDDDRDHFSHPDACDCADCWGCLGWQGYLSRVAEWVKNHYDVPRKDW